MASGTSTKDHFKQFSISTLAGAAGGVLTAAFLAWWNWTAVKRFLIAVGAWFTAVGAWLMGTTGVYRVVLLADFLVLAAFALAALSWHRSRALVVPVSEPAVPLPAPSLPADFKPTSLQVTVILALMKQWQQQTDLKRLADLVQEVTPKLLPMMAEAHISRELEILEAANVVSIDRLGTRYAYYHLTPPGRDWAIQALKSANEKLDAE